MMEKAKQLGVDIISLEIMPDHVHLFGKCKPTFAPHQLVKQFKGNSSKLLRDEFPKLKSRLSKIH
jgi:putative transposase